MQPITAIALNDDEFGELEMESVSWPDRAKNLQILDAPSADIAAEFLTGIKTLRMKIATSCDPMIAAAHATHKIACKQKSDLEMPLIEAERIIKQTIRVYFDSQELRRKQEEDILRMEQRKADEQQRQAEAAAHVAIGDAATARAILAHPVASTPIALPPTSVAGVQSRKKWRAEVTDLLSLLQHIIAHPECLNLVQPNKVAVNALVQSLRDACNIPGITVTIDRIISSGRGTT